MEAAPIILKIPEKRIAVLIGTRGETKKSIERTFKCWLQISSEGDVQIAAGVPDKALAARAVVTAIARGFSPESAMLLKNEQYLLDVLHLPEYIGKRDTALERHTARLIGTRGKARKNIETATDTKISIYGKTVAIIGTPKNVELARRAVEKLIAGWSHRAVYSLVEKRLKI